MSCSYCATPITNSVDFLICERCQANVHVKCLHTCRPGDMLGDVFFDFICAKCMNMQNDMPSTSSYAKTTQPESLVRQHLSWFMVVTLALYNLSIKSKGLSYQGYFHWRSHIVSFISKHWDYMFEPGTKRRKNWLGSISGNLSHFSPDFFYSGQEEVKKPGWWKLTHSCTPRVIHQKYEEYCQLRTLMRNNKRNTEENGHFEHPNPSNRTRRNDEVRSAQVGGCARTIPYMGRKMKVEEELDIDNDTSDMLEQPQQPLNTVQTSLMDFLAESFENDDLNMFNQLPNIAAEPLIDHGDIKQDFLPMLETPGDNIDLFDVPDLKCDFNLNHYKVNSSNEFGTGKNKRFCKAEQNEQEDLLQKNNIELNSPDDSIQTSENSNDTDADNEFKPRILQVTNFQELGANNTGELPHAANNLDIDIKVEQTSDDEQTDTASRITNSLQMQGTETQLDDDESDKATTNVLPPCKPSLFTKKPRRTLPWLVEEAKEISEIAKLTDSNDRENLRMMSEYEETEMLEKLRKVFDLEENCKLEIPSHVRRFYRKLCVRNWKRRHGRPIFNIDDTINGKRYQNDESKVNIIDRYQLISLSTGDKRKSFYARIVGASEHELFESPYTHRILKPFIYRNRVCIPPWIKLMCELQQKVNHTAPTRASIDYCYLRPHHIAAVNALLQSTFWPDIDMSECLSYPDYSVVALYKKLVVGCGFLVPDVGFNEAYISFMAVRPCWQRCGIGTFMLYHLIQTCMTKDITLHVSATNPAVVLYQKFGFKIEEIILDFYEKYLPSDSRQSRTAFFLRLMR